MQLLTIGHSNHPLSHFLDLLAQHGITAVADVRSQPYSRFHPQYNKKRLAEALNERKIEYVFLGEQLGVRSKNPANYREGKVQYALLANSGEFAEGLARVRAGMDRGASPRRR